MSTPDFPTDPEQDKLAAQDRDAEARWQQGVADTDREDGLPDYRELARIEWHRAADARHLGMTDAVAQHTKDARAYELLAAGGMPVEQPSEASLRRTRFAEAQARAALTYVPEQHGPVVVPPPWDPRTETYDTWRAKHFPTDVDTMLAGLPPRPVAARVAHDPLADARPVLGDPRTVDGYPPLTPDRSMWAHPAPASLPYVPGTPGPRVRDHMVMPPWVHAVITLLVAGLWAPIWWLDYRHGRKELLRAVRRG
jgi:hypothetical protein